MSEPLSQGLRITFLIHVVVAAVFGVAFLFAPIQVSQLYGMEVAPPISDILRIIGAAMLGWGLSSLLCLSAKDKESVRIVMWAEVAWTGLGALVMVYAVLWGGFTPLGWLNAAIFAAFALAFALFAGKRAT